MPKNSKRRSRKTAYGIAKTALKKVNKLSSSREIKHYDLAVENLVSPFQVDNVGQLIVLNAGINQGITDSERIGDSIKMLGLRLKFVFDLNGGGQNTFRAILMYDKENTIGLNGDFLTVSGERNIVNSPFKVDQRHKFMILHDKVYTLSQGIRRERQITFSKRINKKTQYLGGGTTITKGALKLWLYSNANPAQSPAPFVYAFSRIYYADS